MKLGPKKGLLIGKIVPVKGLHSNFVDVHIMTGSKKVNAYTLLAITQNQVNTPFPSL
jgi:hypothetical protein